MCIYAYILWFRAHTAASSFYVGPWDLKSGLQTYRTLLPNEPYPWPGFAFWLSNKVMIINKVQDRELAVFMTRTENQNKLFQWYLWKYETQPVPLPGTGSDWKVVAVANPFSSLFTMKLLNDRTLPQWCKLFCQICVCTCMCLCTCAHVCVELLITVKETGRRKKK